MTATQLAHPPARGQSACFRVAAGITAHHWSGNPSGRMPGIPFQRMGK